jgi:predicted nucleic acid-binding protein
MRVTIDTNAYAEFLKGNRHIRNLLAMADEIVVSTIMLGELHADSL